MERNEISLHEVKVYMALVGRNWQTNREITKHARVADRTVRAHTKRFVEMGLCDVAELFPGHRYRLSEKAMKRNAAFVHRLTKAGEVLGVRPARRTDVPRLVKA